MVGTKILTRFAPKVVTGNDRRKRSHFVVRSRLNQEKRLLQNSPRGFTLLEVLIAIVVLSIALLGMASLTGSIISYNQFADNVTTATTLAQDKMEELKNTGYSSITSSSDTDSIYTRTWTVTNDTPATNMKTVEVKVEWTWKGQTRDVVLKTIVAK